MIAGKISLIGAVTLVAAMIPHHPNEQDMPSGFVRLRDVAPNIAQDIRYATKFNFVGDVIPGYIKGECILTRKAASALIEAEKDLNNLGYGLKIFDCYRPERSVLYFVKWAGDDDARMRDVFYPSLTKPQLFPLGYIATPSSHSRGSTVDLGLIRVGEPPLSTPVVSGACDGPFATRPKESSLDLGTSFDCFSPKSAFASTEVGQEAAANRELLRGAMSKSGFVPYEPEWWHFTLKDEPYPKTLFDFPVR